MDITLTLLTTFRYYCNFLSVDLKSYLEKSVDHNITLKVINLGRYSTGIRYIQSPDRTFGKVVQQADVVEISNT